MKELSELSLSDLVALYNNYMIVRTTNCGSAWNLLSDNEYGEVKKEIEKRMNTINFY